MPLGMPFGFNAQGLENLLSGFSIKQELRFPTKSLNCGGSDVTYVGITYFNGHSDGRADAALRFLMDNHDNQGIMSAFLEKSGWFGNSRRMLWVAFEDQSRYTQKNYVEIATMTMEYLNRQGA